MSVYADKDDRDLLETYKRLKRLPRSDMVDSAIASIERLMWQRIEAWEAAEPPIRVTIVDYGQAA